MTPFLKATGLAIVPVLGFHASGQHLAGGKSHLAPTLGLQERVDYAEGGDLLDLLAAADLIVVSHHVGQASSSLSRC